MLAPYPAYDESLCFLKEEEEFERIMNAIKAVRNIRTEKNVPPSRKAHVYIETAHISTFEMGAPFFERLCSASGVTVEEKVEIENAAVGVTESAKLYLPLGELIDKEKELARLHKEQEACQKDIDIISRKLNNADFVAKAPEKVVANEKAKLSRAQDRMQKILESIAAMQ